MSENTTIEWGSELQNQHIQTMTTEHDLSVIKNLDDSTPGEWLGALCRTVIRNLAFGQDPSITLGINGNDFEFRLMRCDGIGFDRETMGDVEDGGDGHVMADSF